MEKRLDGGGGAALEPLADRWREPIYFSLREWTQSTVEPGGGQSERHRFEASQLRRVQVSPVFPEGVVSGVSMEKPSQLVDVCSAHVAAQKMPQQMERRVPQRVRRMEREIRAFVQVLFHPPRPELFDSRSRESFGRFVP